MNIITLQPTITFSGTASITSSRYKGIGYYGSAASLTTLVYAANETFRGTLSVQATLERVPTESDWFEIDTVTVSSGSNPLSRTITKSGQFVWLRSKITNFTAGTVNLITASYSLVSGEQGVQGTQGLQGRQGLQGTNANVQGIQGTIGIQGTQGRQGTSPNKIYSVTNNSNTSYTIDSGSNPTINLIRGFTYSFAVNAIGHPFWIKTSQTTGTGNAFSSGITNNGIDNGVIFFAVPFNAPNTLYYICQNHGIMTGIINISDLGPQGIQGTTGIQGPIGPENFEIDGGNASTIYLAEIEIDGGNANG